MSVEHHTDETKARIAAAHVGVPKSDAHRKAISEGLLRRSRNGGVAPHGTPARYKNAHCHCDECRAAWREYIRERRAAKKATAS